jgi:peptide/nickel transport system ATP-binding protein
MSVILETQNLKTYFNTPHGKLHAVDDVSISIERGETLGVVGESGCGKSTLGRTIIHLTEPTSGKILFEGKDITKVSKKECKELRRDIQMIFQDPYSSLDPRMSVTQLIEEPLLIYRLCASKEERQKYVFELMDTVGIARRFANSYPHELDGGRRQRIGIARALSLKPKFIVCDEPVSALDVSIQAQVLNLLQDLQKEKGLTYMFITHDLSVVKHISNNICVMYMGTVVEKSETKELFRNPKHPYTKALLSAILRPTVDRKRKRLVLKGEVTSPIEPHPGCRFAPRCEIARDRCFREDPSLVDLGGGHYCACFDVN